MGPAANETPTADTARADGRAGEEERSPGPPSRRVRWVRNLAILVAVVLVAELSVRFISPYLLPPQSPGVGEVALKYSQLQGLATNGGVDLVFVGDSTLDAGVDPAAAAAASGRFSKSYNAALRGARLPTQRVWVFDRMVPLVRPKLVVQGMTPTLISSLGASPTDLTAFDTMLTNNLRSLDPDIWQQADAKLSDQLYLVRYRSSLRSPRLVGTAAWNRITGNDELPTNDLGADYWRKITSPNGQSIEYSLGVADASKLEPVFAAIRSLLEGGYSFDAFDSMIDSYRNKGLPMLIVIPPVASDLLVKGGVDMKRWHDMTAQIAAHGRERGVTVLDFSDRAYPAEWYFDPFHLNGTGSRQFSTDVGTAIADACQRDASLRCG